MDQNQSSESIISLCWLELQCHFNLQSLKQNLAKSKGNTSAIHLHSTQCRRSHAAIAAMLLSSGMSPLPSKAYRRGCSSEIMELGRWWWERETCWDIL